MAVSPTYPGVYIIEETSVPHVVTPATTNLTAFIGEFPRGPIDQAVLVSSQADFEAKFGQIEAGASLAAFGVQQFFLNGGIGAWIVRVAPPKPPEQAPATAAASSGDTPAADQPAASGDTPAADQPAASGDTPAADQPAASGDTPAADQPAASGDKPAADQPAASGDTPAAGDDSATPQAAAAASATILPQATNAPAITLNASSPGQWANGLFVTMWPSSSVPSSGNAAYCDVCVWPSSPGDPPSASAPAAAPSATGTYTPPPQPLERIPNIQVLGSSGAALTVAQIAQAINKAGSAYVTADTTTASGTTPAATGKLDGGNDGVWATNGFADAIVQECQAGGRLDQIAPNVFNLMCIPDAADPSKVPATTVPQVIAYAQAFCQSRQAFLLVDPPNESLGAVKTWAASYLTQDNIAGAMYYPWLQIADPDGNVIPVPPSGTVAGVYARTDVSRGVWKAPAGTDATLRGINDLCDNSITDTINGELNAIGINCLRTFPLYGSIVWGARTLAGSDIGSNPYKYVPVRRLADFIEQSLVQSLRWAVFEPNGPGLWSSISLEVQDFMAGLFRQGAFAGNKASDAYQVTCDATTTSPTDMLEGIVNVNVAFAPVDPAEFVMLNITLESPADAS